MSRCDLLNFAMFPQQRVVSRQPGRVGGRARLATKAYRGR